MPAQRKRARKLDGGIEIKTNNGKNSTALKSIYKCDKIIQISQINQIKSIVKEK